MSKKNILIIEDDIELTEMLKLHLEGKRKTYKVSLAHDGEEGLKAIRAQKPDLVILDINLPKMGGIEVYKAIQKDANKVPVLIFTARSELEDFFEDINAEGFISKPFDIEQLLIETDRILANKEKPTFFIIDTEDSPIVKHFSKAAKRTGYKMLVTPTLNMFKAAAAKLKPSLIFLEYEQGEKDGQELIKEVLAVPESLPKEVWPPKPKVPVISYAYSAGHFKQLSLDAGADMYVGAPQNQDDCVSVIREITRKVNKDKEVSDLLNSGDNADSGKPSTGDLSFFG